MTVVPRDEHHSSARDPRDRRVGSRSRRHDQPHPRRTGLRDAAAYRTRRDLALECLAREGLPGSRPDGAFYALADVSAAGTDSASFARALVARAGGVACAPGDSFGPGAAGLLRLSLAAPAEAIEAGIRTIGRAVRGDA